MRSRDKGPPLQAKGRPVTRRATGTGILVNVTWETPGDPLCLWPLVCYAAMLLTKSRINRREDAER